MKLIPQYKAFSPRGDYLIFLKMQHEHALSLPKKKYAYTDGLLNTEKKLFFFHEYLVFQMFCKHEIKDQKNCATVFQLLRTAI